MTTPHAARRPLDGVLVADFSRVLAGPLATMFLADLGATVVKVERPGAGDDTRQWGPPWVGDTTTYFAGVNRGKRSVTLDLGQEADLALARELARRADVLVENFLPGTLARYGLDAESTRAANPGLVYCSVTGFGSGPGATRPGYDFVVQAVGGLMSITGDQEGEPVKAGVALVDVLTGLHATIGVLAALRDRDAHGRGQVVEVSLLSSLVASLVNQASAVVNGAAVPGRMGNAHPSIAPYETLRTADGPLAVAVGNDRQFAAMTQVLAVPLLAGDTRFATNADRVANRPALVGALEQALATAGAGAWADRLQAVGVPCGRVEDIAGGIALAEELELSPVVTHDGPVPVRTLANPVRFSRTELRHDRRPPSLGADSEEVRRWLTAAEPAPLGP
ncbi:CoA transferase [Klenkia sp. LSe6-5]|uniref:CoA transferase n=1 Tax=Klenkia sesuvii TaxID=3103137 RepID=A0ABU8DQP0_9ACTN